MKFKYPLLTTSLLAALAFPVAFAGDDANGSGTGEGSPMNGATPGDTQKVQITIPEVSLIDVTNQISVELSPPTDAGDNFQTVTVGGNPNYDISANIPAATPAATKKIVATSDNIPAGWQFSITMNPPSASGSSTGIKNLTPATTSVDLVTGIGNVAEKNIGMEVKIGPENANVMPSHTGGTAKDVNIVYTITAG
ncbi:MAG: hypothetical protein CSB47_04475 [Proteobacteria bacterium]|nr:MAG: hypothetical protein CSB47_04475 [Pseudomonadota bacterium]